jgi:hypothetical protein
MNLKNRLNKIESELDRMKMQMKSDEDMEALRFEHARQGVRRFYPSATETELDNLARELIEANLAHLRERKESAKR